MVSPEFYPVMTDDERPWLTLTEAADTTGLDRETLRSRARRGLIPRRHDNRGHWLVQIAPGLGQGQSRGNEPSPTTVTKPDHGDARGQNEADRGQEVVTDLLAEVAELRTALARTEAERDAATRVAEAEVGAMRGQLEQMREALTKAEARADRLEAELAHLRRPWLERLLEALRRR